MFWLRKPLLSKVLEDYLENAGLAPTTIRHTRGIWAAMLEITGDIAINRFTTETAAQVQRIWTGRISHRSAVSYRKTVSPVFSWAVKEKYIKTNPFSGLKKPKVTKRQVRFYSNAEFERLLAACSTVGDPFRWMLCLLLARSTGLRKSALQNLTWNEIDFESETIRLQEKRDTKETWGWRPKDAEERTLCLVPVVSRLLTELAYQSRAVPYVLLKPARYYHLVEMKELGLMTEVMRLYPISNFDRIFRKIKRRAKVKGRFHDLRATCITDLTDVLNLNELAQFAGHSDIQTTAQYIGIRETAGMVNRARRQVNASLAAIITPSQALCQTELRPEFTR